MSIFDTITAAFNNLTQLIKKPVTIVAVMIIIVYLIVNTEHMSVYQTVILIIYPTVNIKT